MGRKKKIKLSKGPCKWCGHNELFDSVCFKCGKTTFESIMKNNGSRK